MEECTIGTKVQSKISGWSEQTATFIKGCVVKLILSAVGQIAIFSVQ